PLGNDIGAEIIGLDLRKPLSAAVFEEVEAALFKYAVIAIRKQDIDTTQLSDFGRRFGPLQISGRRHSKNKDSEKRIQPDSLEVNYISNVKVDGKNLGSDDAGRYWHSDLCYETRTSKATILHAIEVPVKDGVVYGATQFTDVAAAYDALPGDVKIRLAGLMAANSFRLMWNRKARQFGNRPLLSEEELSKFPPDAIHPVVRSHPVTKRKCLYVCEGYTDHILDMPEQESRDLLEFLFVHVIKDEFRYQHEWQQGDVLIWDNCAVQHKATFDYAPPLRRLMQRCTVQEIAGTH
ncbi:MAG: TauD/TfdA family dioxygenase, partial [Rhodospirillales bacterium]